jgi:hypothetical protein
MTDGPLHWDVSSKRRGRIGRLFASRATVLFVVIGSAASAVIVVPLVVLVLRVGGSQADVHRLERMAKAAQPASARLVDSGIKDSKGVVGFADGVSSQTAAALLSASPPPPWVPGPAIPEAPDTRLYHSGHLVLSVKVTSCQRLAQCRPGDSFVYTEVQDIS